MSEEGKYLVDVLTAAVSLHKQVDTSMIRRAVVEGKVTVNDDIVDDPAAKLDTAFPSFIGYEGELYPYYP